MMALAIASSLALLADLHGGPDWLQWIGSFVALATALGVVVAGEVAWQRAVSAAKAADLVRSDS
jgi:hypothetical protein